MSNDNEEIVDAVPENEPSDPAAPGEMSRRDAVQLLADAASRVLAKDKQVK